MASFTRKNAWNNGGTLEGNTDLLWYARAVSVMQSRPISDPTSWWFYGAIHGQYLLDLLPAPYTYLNWENIKYIPASAKLNNLPPETQTDLFWEQCQHGTWFFLPWHRGYLAAIESILRDIIVKQLNGPADWALPYWNYLNQSVDYPQFQIPPAFTSEKLPEGAANPLYVPERYGPLGDGNVYVEVGADIETSATDECQWDTVYTEAIPSPATGPGDLFGYTYGGPKTGFAHADGTSGDLESNPHNHVHGMVGGPNGENIQMGLMSVPNTAALDPIFYLHHANIDRMWAAWNTDGKNNPTDPDWLQGPFANGNSRFAMPVNAQADPWYYTPADMQDTNNLKYYQDVVYAYTYDDLDLTSYDTTPPDERPMSLVKRISKFGLTTVAKKIKMGDEKKPELVGASNGPVSLNSGDTHAIVKLKSTTWKSVSKSFSLIAENKQPDEVFLQLEGVRGGNDSNFLSVFINDKFVKSVSLFGLLGASLGNSSHGNAGLTFNFNITNIVDDLHLGHNIDINSLNVRIKTKNPIPAGGEITIGRMGVYRLGQ